MNEQDVQKRYEEAVNLLNTNIDGAKTFLEKWEKEDPGNPELYSLWFNYYYGKSMQSVIELAPQPAPGASGYAITDSTGRTVGYLQERTIFNDTLLSMAFNWLDRELKPIPIVWISILEKPVLHLRPTRTACAWILCAGQLKGLKLLEQNGCGLLGNAGIRNRICWSSVCSPIS
jgi:hypothetical protein